MLHSLQSNARRLAAETRGAEIAEAAAVLPLMFMMLLGIFWFGQAFSIYGAITRAAQEGARAGAAPICATCVGANTTAQSDINAATAVQAALVASKLDPNQSHACQYLPLRLPPAARVHPNPVTSLASANVVCSPSRLSNSTTDGALRHLRLVSIPVPVLAAIYVSEQATESGLRLRPARAWRLGDSRASCLGTCLTGRIRSGWRDDHAAQLVEFAVSLPLLVLFVVGIFDFSNAFTLKQKLTNVARDAARAAAAEPSSDLQSARLPMSVVDAFQDIDNYLLANNLSDCVVASVGPLGPPLTLAWKYQGTGLACPPGGLTIIINRGYYFPRERYISPNRGLQNSDDPGS